MGNWSSKQKETAVSSSSPNSASLSSQRPSTVIYCPPTSASASYSSGTRKLYPNISPRTVSPSASVSGTNSYSTFSSLSSQTNVTSSYHVTATTGLTTPLPKTPVVGNQTVKHSVNNYVMPKLQKGASSLDYHITVPYKKSVDKFALRVCTHYNSKNGCRAVICRRFHVCYYWVLETCRKDSCGFDHSFDALHNQIIMNTLTNKRNFSTNMVSESLRNNHKYNRRSKRQDPSICMFSIIKNCKQNPCSLIHANKSYVWELKDKNDWLQLAYQQSDVLEQHFCHPDQEAVELPSVPNIGALKRLRSLLCPDRKWKADFLKMEIGNDLVRYELRRLSTPSDICYLKSMNRLATRWIWYWQDKSGLWKPYTDGCGKFYLIGLSDQLEFHYNFSDDNEPVFEVTLGFDLCYINVRTLMQSSLQTGNLNVRRRPSYVETRSEEIHFDRFFSTSSDEDNVRHGIPPTSPEFAFIKGLMKASSGLVTLLSVERIVNNHLWKAYQNKKDQLMILYQGDLSLINEQFMFHGTKHSVIDEICNENFDWRLHGSNVGHVFGHGVYFSNLASVADAYSETNSTGKVMFIAMVLVGSLAIGDQRMRFPPRNEETNRCFDTTCDDKISSTKFVKYNRDEYYPAYLAHYR